MGSGNRTTIRTYTEESLGMSVSFFKERGFFNDTTGTGRINWSRDGEKIAEIGYSVLPDRIMLDYRVNGEPVQESIHLEHTPCHYGGSRTWFQCPNCGKRSGVLYLAGKYFVCRKCGGIHYASQSESETDRAIRKARKYRKQLQADADIDAPIMRKPKGMHWKTFERLVKQSQKAADRANDGLWQYMQRLVGNDGLIL
jgi:hypothetical protein